MIRPLPPPALEGGGAFLEPGKELPGNIKPPPEDAPAPPALPLPDPSIAGSGATGMPPGKGGSSDIVGGAEGT